MRCIREQWPPRPSGAYGIGSIVDSAAAEIQRPVGGEAHRREPELQYFIGMKEYVPCSFGASTLVAICPTAARWFWIPPDARQISPVLRTSICAGRTFQCSHHSSACPSFRQTVPQSGLFLSGKETGVSGQLRPQRCGGHFRNGQDRLWNGLHHGSPSRNCCLYHWCCFYWFASCWQSLFCWSCGVDPR